MKNFLLLVLIMVIVSACAPKPETIHPISSTATTAYIPTNTTTRLVTETTPSQTVKWSIREIMDILIASNPQASIYDPSSKQYAKFPEALKQLKEMEPNILKDEDLNLSILAAAINYPRQDSILAGDVLITFPPKYVGTTLPELIDFLSSSRSDVRKYALILLGYVGSGASCTVGNIGPILFLAKDPSVRSTSAIALDNILNKGFVPAEYKVTSNFFSIHSIPNDDPAGSFTGRARTWWQDEGSKINWHPNYDLCDP